MQTSDKQLEKSEIGFSRQVENRLQKNFYELSTIAGNIFGLNKKTRSIYVTSCFRGEGKTTAAINCAFGLSQIAHNNVLLIDGHNGFSPTLSHMLGLDDSVGFTDIIFSTVKLSHAIKSTKYKRLDFIPFGTISDEKLTVSTKKRINQILQELPERYDTIIIDGDSVHGASEVELIVDCFDFISIVIECERTKWEVLQNVSSKIQISGGNAMGVILNARKYYIPKFFYGKI